MIISKTPLRMSFVGGGSDLPSFYREFGGAVLSTTINKYVYVTANRKFDNGIRVSYSRTEEVDSVDKIDHRIVRAALPMMGVHGGVEITTIADIPSRGSGLGSSSAFAVGLLNALAAFQGRYISSADLSEMSCQIEIDICGEPIGKQDQYAVAYGGLNVIEFLKDDTVHIAPVIVRKETAQQLQNRLLMFYSGTTRSASGVLAEQLQNTSCQPDKQKALRRMVDLVHVLREELQADQLDAFGEILHENWLLKKSLATGVSSRLIDEAYEAARSSGAMGGKILGAGAAGFLLFYAPEDRHRDIEQALAQLRRIPFEFEPLGSRIIFYNP